MRCEKSLVAGQSSHNALTAGAHQRAGAASQLASVRPGGVQHTRRTAFLGAAEPDCQPTGAGPWNGLKVGLRLFTCVLEG